MKKIIYILILSSFFLVWCGDKDNTLENEKNNSWANNNSDIVEQEKILEEIEEDIIGIFEDTEISTEITNTWEVEKSVENVTNTWWEEEN